MRIGLFRLAREAIGCFGASRVARPLLVYKLRRQINIVYYHYIGGNRPHYNHFFADCSLERFEKEMAVLKSRFNVVPLAEVLRVNNSSVLPSRPMMSVTFDDGFDQIGNGVMDVLDRYGISATVFVITSCVGNGELMWRNKLSAVIATRGQMPFVASYNAVMKDHGHPAARAVNEAMHQSSHWPMDQKEVLTNAIWNASAMPPLKTYLERYRPYMTWESLQRWMEHGHGVGLHTRSHPVCSHLSRAQIEDEIVAPAGLLKDRLGLRSVPFSYPFGDRLPRHIEADLCKRGTIECALGIRGFSRLGTKPDQLERAGVEEGFAYPVFGKPFVSLLFKGNLS